MVKSGVNPKTAQSLARHSTIDLTMNVYTSLTVHDQASALASLPAVPDFETPVSTAGALRATGTEGPKKVPALVPRGAGCRRRAAQGAASGAIRLASDASETAPDCAENGDGPATQGRAKDAKNPGESGELRVSSHRFASRCQAERGGFEPPVGVNPLRFSRPVQSAALPPLRPQSPPDLAPFRQGGFFSLLARGASGPCAGLVCPTTDSRGTAPRHARLHTLVEHQQPGAVRRNRRRDRPRQPRRSLPLPQLIGSGRRTQRECRGGFSHSQRARVCREIRTEGVGGPGS